MLRVRLAALVLALGCGSVSTRPDAAPTPDAAPPPAGPRAKQVLTGSGRMTGGGITLDAKVGAPFPGKATGGGTTLRGGSAK